MRQLAIATLVLWLSMTAAAQAQTNRPSTYGAFAPNPKPPKPFGAAASDPFKAPEPYRPHASPTPPLTMAPMKPVGRFDEGPKTFKPFKGTSIYSDPGFVKPFKPAKMKSVYDR